MATSREEGTRDGDEVNRTLEILGALVQQSFFFLDTLNLPDTPHELPCSEKQRAVMESGLLDIAEELLFYRYEETLLSTFLRAVRKSRDRAEGENRQRLNRYLRNIAHLMFSRPNPMGPVRILLQSMMEFLIRVDLTFVTDVEPRRGDFLAHNAVPRVFISLGDKDLDVPFENILQTFWTDGLDSPCHNCGKAFDDSEPPIRTVCLRSDPVTAATNLHQPGLSAGAPVLSLRIMNRHLKCLESSGTTSVPVSHVWDDAIIAANALTPPSHHKDGAQALVSALHGLLTNVRDVYPPSTEFWHDYVSVPQWRPAVQQAILQRLPRIYNISPEILVQCADLPPRSVQLVLESRRSMDGYGKLMLNYMPPLTVVIHEFERSQWMARMWVALEFAQCQRAVLMDASGKIWRSRDDESERDTFTDLVLAIWTLVTAMTRVARFFTQSLNILQSGSLALLIKLKTQGLEGSLGQATQFVGSRECFRPADRFIAIHAMLNRNSQHIPPVPVELDATASCRWVWRHAMVRGDLSPLLLKPRESHPGSEPPASLPSWLVGYNGLERAAYDLGTQKSAPAYREVTITEYGVQLQLQYLGRINTIHYLDLADEATDSTTHVSHLIDLLLQHSVRLGQPLSAEKIVDEVYRVISMNIGVTDAARVAEKPKICLNYSEHVAQTPDFDKKVAELLQSFVAAEDDDARFAVAKMLGTLLQLDNGFRWLDRMVTRYGISRALADWRQTRGAVRGEPICELECPECRGLSLCRLDLRPTAKVGDMVYIIPGLSYEESVENGVGLVLGAGRIVGRMILGAHDCGCHGPEIVEVL